MLIAMPGIGDDRFERAIIYICAHNTDGAMGLIVNKVAEELDFVDLLDQLNLLERTQDGVVHATKSARSFWWTRGHKPWLCLA